MYDLGSSSDSWEPMQAVHMRGHEGGFWPLWPSDSSARVVKKKKKWRQLIRTVSGGAMRKQTSLFDSSCGYRPSRWIEQSPTCPSLTDEACGVIACSVVGHAGVIPTVKLRTKENNCLLSFYVISTDITVIDGLHCAGFLKITVWKLIYSVSAAYRACESTKLHL